MKTNILVILFLACSLIVSSRDVTKKRVVDINSYRITYNFKYFYNVEHENKNIDIQALDIGTNFIYYHSLLADDLDSAYYKIKGQHINALSLPNPGNPKHKYAIYNDYYSTKKDPNIFKVLSQVASVNYQYIDTIAVLEWEILTDTKNILGYPCSLATTTFKGRQWYAYFALDIPIRLGPWKLRGLPGLILYAYDDKNRFEFEAIGISQTNLGFIYDYNVPIAKINRKNMLKILDLRWKDPVSLVNASGQSISFRDQNTKQVTLLKSGDVTRPRIENLELE